MKHSCNFYVWKSILFIVILIILNNGVMAQVPSDTTKAKVDTTAMMPADTTKPAQAAAATPPPHERKEENQSNSVFMLAEIRTRCPVPQPITMQIQALGYQLGVAWKKGGFVYWQVGLRYNNAVYGF